MNIERIVNLIFPPLCVNCEKNIPSGNALCDDCFGRVTIHQTLFCGRCQSRLPQGIKTCHRDFPYLFGAATDYEDEAVKNLVRVLKFKFIEHAAEPLTRLMFTYIKNLSLDLSKFTLVPIPLHPARERSRGFNQSLLIARRLSVMTGLPVMAENLIRIRNTPPQSERSDHAERATNVAECFSLLRPLEMRGKNVLLVDDVATSGSTLFEAARTVRHAGGKKIIGLVAAKA
ncbi:MAG: ComF family protein [Patescibacteria group bacterium]